MKLTKKKDIIRIFFGGESNSILCYYNLNYRNCVNNIFMVKIYGSFYMKGEY